MRDRSRMGSDEDEGFRARLKREWRVDDSDPLRRLQLTIFKVGTLVILVLGGLSPLFRQDVEALVVSAICVVLLGIIAALAWFRSPRK